MKPWKVFKTNHGDYCVTDHDEPYGHIAYHMDKAAAELIVEAVNKLKGLNDGHSTIHSDN